MRVLSSYSAHIQSYRHNLTSEAGCKEQANWSDQQEVDTTGLIALIRSIIILFYRLLKPLDRR